MLGLMLILSAQKDILIAWLIGNLSVVEHDYKEASLDGYIYALYILAQAGTPQELIRAVNAKLLLRLWIYCVISKIKLKITKELCVKLGEYYDYIEFRV